MGVHPHRGFETVTIVYEGEVDHRDSTGAGGVIGPGDVQWMTAASGILHEEFHEREFGQRGGTFEMVQLWVNLPADATRWPRRATRTLLADDIPPVDLPDGAGTVRVIAGEFDGAQGPARTFTPINLWDVRLAAGRSVDLPFAAERTTWPCSCSRGTVTVNGAAVPPRRARRCSTTTAAACRRGRRGAPLLVLSGEPIDEPIVGYGPFVMNTTDEIRQAFADFDRGAFGRLD